MATLADELLADLMDSDSGESEAYDDQVDENVHTTDDQQWHEETSEPSSSTLDVILRPEFKPLLDNVGSAKISPQLSRSLSDLLTSNESNILTKANALGSALDDEIMATYKALRDHYSVRFPELEQLIQNPLQYIKAVAVIGNGPMKSIAQDSLKEVLDGSLVMAVKMEATRTTGRDLTASETGLVDQLVATALKLNTAKQFLASYIKSRINFIAPNLTVLLGSDTASQLVSSAGGIGPLAKIPACNIPAMGSKQTVHGLASNTRVKRQGHIYYSPLVQSVAPDHRNQAMRIVSAKCSLAARCDAVRSTPDGSTGERLRLEIEERIEKLTLKAPNAQTRALPAPDDKPARKRGGRRARKAKEQYAMTELRKAQNRVAFGKEEAEVGLGDETEGLGMIGQAQDGRVRALAMDQRTKAKLSKKNSGWNSGTGNLGTTTSLRGFGSQDSNLNLLQGSGLRSSGVGTSFGAGMNSVIAFTPFQGLELVNPKVKEEIERKRKAEDNRWFNSGTFTQVGSSAERPRIPTDDAAGFKVPALPLNKRSKNTSTT